MNRTIHCIRVVIAICGFFVLPTLVSAAPQEQALEEADNHWTSNDLFALGVTSPIPLPS